MKKNNKNGFVLAEAVIVSVFVLGMFTLLITNILPSTGQYQKVLTYDNPEDIYKVNTLIGLLEGEVDDYYKSVESVCSDSSFCKEMLGENFLNIKEIYINTSIPSSLSCEILSRGMKEYCEYFKKHNKSISENKIYLVKFGNGTYAGLVR